MNNYRLASAILGATASFLLGVGTVAKSSELQDRPYKESILSQAAKYSETHQVLAITIYKGTENEDDLTGQEIFDLLSDNCFGTKSGDAEAIPTKGFIDSSTGKYTAISYYIKGLKFGPYSINQAVENAVIIRDKFHAAFSRPSRETKSVTRRC